jgi:hypothetical protein
LAADTPVAVVAAATAAAAASAAAALAASKLTRDARKKEDRKWEKNGMTTMAKWLNMGISKRDDRKENPDRDKTTQLNR